MASKAVLDADARKSTARTALPARAAPLAGSSGWYVVAQGETAEVIQSGDRPSTEPVPGERIIEVEGPFLTELDALSRHERMTEGRHARRLRFLKERGTK